MAERTERNNRSITRSPELSEELDSFLVHRGWSHAEWANRSHVGQATVGRIFNLEDPKRVSRITFKRMVTALIPDSSLRNDILQLAGVPTTFKGGGTFGNKINGVINRFDLSPANRRVLEQELLAHAKTFGTILEQAQKGKTLTISAKRHLRQLPSN